MKAKNQRRPELYNRFYAIYARCNNPNAVSYKRYGAKGVKCEWQNYKEFEADMYANYLEHVAKYGKKATQIDRIDSNGNYSKKNCRWVTLEEQSNNRKNIKYYTHNGKTLTLTGWSKELNISLHTLYTRLFRHHWPIEQVFTSNKRVNQYV